MSRSTKVEAKETPAGRPWYRFETLSSLRYRDFRFLCIGNFILSAGLQIQQVTLGWLLYDMTNSPWLLGLLNAVRSFPVIVVAPVAGIVADRTDRRMVLMRAHWVLSISAFIMGILVLLLWAEPWHLFVFTLVSGVAWTLVQPMRFALVSSVVPRSEVANAIALNSTGFNSTRILGPVFGGALIAAFGPGGNFLVQGAAYAAVIYMFFLMRIPAAPMNPKKGSALGDFVEGIGYVWANRMILALMVTSLVPSVFGSPLQVLLPVFQKDVLQVGPQELGMMLGATGIGAVAATITVASLSGRVPHKGRVMLIALILWGGLQTGFALSPWLPLSLVFLVGTGFCQIVCNLTNNTILQMTAPDNIRGRVMSTYMLVQGLSPLGAMIAGAATALVGAPVTLAVMGAIISVLGILVAWRMPRMSRWTEHNLTADAAAG